MKIQILKQEKDFAHTRFKKSFSSPSLRIRMAVNSQNSPRFGFIIPKKVMPKVTERNKVKRRLKAIIQKNIGSIRPADILVFPQKTSLKKNFSDLESELVSTIKKLSLWKS